MRQITGRAQLAAYDAHQVNPHMGYMRINSGITRGRAGWDTNSFLPAPAADPFRTAASCQRVLGASANLAKEYATKRYRSNCINWGMAP